jgi:hypothetical protein
MGFEGVTDRVKLRRVGVTRDRRLEIILEEGRRPVIQASADFLDGKETEPAKVVAFAQ